MIIKICGITTGEDARVAVEAGASALGFNFYRPSPRFIEPAAARRIAAMLPADVLKVGVFVKETPARIAEAMEEANLDVAQVIGPGPGAARTWKVVRVDDRFSAESLEDPAAEAFLLDTPSDSLHGGTGRTFDWSRASIPGKRIVIAGGLGPDNVAAAIRVCLPWGVDACSQLESSPGRKDPDKVRAFVAAALSL
jgi:phosphoribosylanthranilate isomerase